MAIAGFAGTLRKLRKERNLTQKQLADAVSLSQRQISLLESDKEVPRAETIERLRNFFHLDVDTWNDLLEQESALSAQATPPDTIGRRVRVIQAISDRVCKGTRYQSVCHVGNRKGRLYAVL